MSVFLDRAQSGSLTEPLLQEFQRSEQPQSSSPVSSSRISQLRDRGSQEIGSQSLSGLRVTTDDQSVQQATVRLQGTAPRQAVLPRTIDVTIPPNGVHVQMEGRMVEHEMSSLPRDQRQQAIQNVAQTLSTRVQNGYDVWREVSAGTKQGPATQEEIRDLMTFLMANSLQKGPGFSEGAFNVEDPGHRLRNFLDSSPEVYQRPSSHIEGFQQAGGGSHRGIDVTGGVHLPYGKATVLYGAMSDGVQGLQGDRLFLKMEEHGCRLSSHWTPNRDTNMRPDRPARLGDVGQFLGHAMGFFRTVLRGLSGGRLFPNATDSRKERIPSDVERGFKNMLKGLDDGGQAAVADILRRNTPLATSQGIRVMVTNLDHALGQELEPETRTQLQRFRDSLALRFDHLDVRIGNEVVLNQSELSPPGQ